MVTDLLRDLIAIPSVNPDGDPGTDQIGELACANYVAAFLKKCGAEVTMDEVMPGRPNVIGRFPIDRPDKPCVLFGPHTDTVGVGGMSIDPFGGDLREGKIWGRGASDTKGSMAAMLWALHELRDVIPTLGVKVMFVGFMSEESEQYGSQHFAKHYRHEVDLAIIGEPTGMDIVFAHKACWWMDITTRGVAAHGSRPEWGDNAVLKMMRLLQELETGFYPGLPQYDDDVLGTTTVSVNMLKGGTRPNIVPDACTVVLDIRATPRLHDYGVDAALREFLDGAGYKEAELSIRTKSPVLKTDTKHPLLQPFLAQGSKPVTAPWFCDAGWLAEVGIPSVAMGPGSIAQAHTKDEWLSVADLEDSARRFADYLRSFR